MAINTGLIEATLDAGGSGPVVIRIYYDATQPVSDSQPLVNGPRGYCLDLTNPGSGRPVRLTVTLPNQQSTTIQIGTGDPVTTGPQSGRSRTLAQMQQIGFATRGDVQGLELNLA